VAARRASATCWGRFKRSKNLVTMRREILYDADGDDLIVDHVDSVSETAPRLVLLHGLEGSSYSVYMQA